MNENVNTYENEEMDSVFDLDELLAKLDSEYNDELGEWKLFEEEKVEIGNSESLVKTIESVIWEQIINQIGVVAGEDFIVENSGMFLDLRKDSHIQTTENFVEGKIALHNREINYQKRYDEWQDNFVKDENGRIVMHQTRSGKDVAVLTCNARKPFDEGRPRGSAEKHTDMDHTVSAAEIIRDSSANAHMAREEQIAFANSEVNLNEIDSSWNRSKRDKSMREWLDTPNANGQKPNEIFDIGAEDDKRMRQKDAEAREEFERMKREGEERSIVTGKKSQKEEAFRIGGKALRTAIMGLLAELIREIISKLIMWIRMKEKNFPSFIEQVKIAIKSFVENLKQTIMRVSDAVVTTIATSIIGPVVGTVKKIWSLIKEGGDLVKEVIQYIKNSDNKNKPISLLMMDVGKIVVAGLTASGALLLGEFIEKGLMTIPAFAFEIPLLGNLANIIGIFLGAIVCGIAGALVLNLIERMLAKKRMERIIELQIDKGNEVLKKQDEIFVVSEMCLQQTKKKTIENIMMRHSEAVDVIRKAGNTIIGTHDYNNEKRFQNIEHMLDELPKYSL